MKKGDWELLKQNASDKDVVEKIEKEAVKRARTTAIVLGSFLMVAFLAVVYAYVQVVKARNAEKALVVVQQQLKAETAEAQKQQALAVESKMVAEEAAKVAYEELEKCRKKK